MKLIVTVFLSFIFSIVYSQTFKPKRTYDYLTLAQSWKIVVDSNNNFILTTNKLFWPDTSIILKGKVIQHDSVTQFITDTTSLEAERFLKMVITHDQSVPQGVQFPSFKNFIFFVNAQRRAYHTEKFSETVTATYYRGDGKWANVITLNEDKTYRVSESVHGTEEYWEEGKWIEEKGFIKFIPNQKENGWLDKYSSNKTFYVTKDFLIGRVVSKGKRNETYFYFCKGPIFE